MREILREAAHTRVRREVEVSVLETSCFEGSKNCQNLCLSVLGAYYRETISGNSACVPPSIDENEEEKERR